MNYIQLLLPDFSLILLGAAIRRWMHLGDHFWTGVEKLVYFILFPAMLINALTRTHLDLLAAIPLLATSFTTIAAGMLLGLLPKPFSQMPAPTYASLYQCAFRFNSYIGLAIASMLFGTAGVATMGIVIGSAVPFVNLAAVWMLARHGQLGLWRELLRNPLIWATVIGFTLNAIGFTPPAPAQVFLGRLSDASVALGLIAVGGFAAAVLLFAGLAWLAVKLLRRLVNEATAPRWLVMATRQVSAKPVYAVVQVSSLAVGLLALVLLVLLRTDLIASWRKATPANAPDRFVINVQPDQAQDFQAALKKAGVHSYDWYPMIRGRLIAVNGKAVSPDDYEEDRAKRLVDREFNISTAETMPDHNQIVGGRWQAGEQGVPFTQEFRVAKATFEKARLKRGL